MGPDPSDDDPFDDPFGGDPLRDPFENDPLEDPFEDPAGDSESDEDLERAFAELSSETLLAFIVVGVLVHVGVFAGALGLMFLGFRGQWLIGGGLVIVGTVALGLAVATYRRYRARTESETSASSASARE
ncbi:hypothetical protein Htur_2786 [Haloterrigena turkmenica DSM 5511]|uniref:DUF7322 domain-containing protein n=1 Tax=Haloterrigena turkmenica (strain ATCC 51198 / DSM 5511 / JCM 9101 / NCIMB 13204 / VKM B-1734 / 4k) TaxID=543526 RepID=D2RXD5_HALTV|nr:hypothetical protein [Haloterrigena turkmenica]ADB61659.1 hypothetical protein Htur_2786 [Haloterrigena turkmenica DSM 5511]